MECGEIRVDNRSRKRRKRSMDRPQRCKSKLMVDEKGKALIGRYVKKDFIGIGVFLGKIVNYDQGLYRVDYEDGDCEDLEFKEVREILVDDGDFDEEFRLRKSKLDQLISKPVISSNGLERFEVSSVDKESSDLESDNMQKTFDHKDGDSSSDSCDSFQVPASETPVLQPLPLPPSSGDVGVPEGFVSHLFSVYNFLRSFSRLLFLSPFALDDFVGSLKCTVPNSLFDAVHVSLMRALRRHLEMFSSDGKELASKCVRCLDWNLLDTLTWPVYLVEYLLIMGYTKGPNWRGFYAHVLDGDYYSIPVSEKLKVLQILCDDVMESAELRAELDMRESTVDIEFDETASLPPDAAPGNGPRRVYPRYSKTSACKTIEAVEKVVKPFDSLSPQNRSSLDFNFMEPEVNEPDDDDGNSDECCLCGMDGTLVCCDGCPSAYHSRCIGLSKALLPDGSWFCPECMVNKIGRTCSKIVMGLRGSEVFGIDPYERVFMGTCNYLLVLETSVNSELISRYYNENDVLKVLRLLSSSVEHTNVYSQICKGISQYWEEILVDTSFSHSAITEPGIHTLDEKEDAMDSTSLSIAAKGTCKLLNSIEDENASNVTEITAENGKLDCRDNDLHEFGVNGSSLESVRQSDTTDTQKHVLVTDDKSLKVAEAPLKTGIRPSADLCLRNTKFPELLGTESSIYVDPSDLNNQSSADKSVVLEFAARISGDGNATGREDADSIVLLTKNDTLTLSHESRQDNPGGSGANKGDTIDGGSCMGAVFQPQAYVNLYIHGDIAASAAANLAVLAAEESKVFEAHASSNPRRTISANISLQVKAFSGAAMHFFWPSSEKKLMEVPREKCGWCISCKGPVTNKKGCLLNVAATNAMKGAAKVLGSLRPIKNGEGQLPVIAAYISHMEESLRGLIGGPLLTSNYRRLWRKLVDQASTCRDLKFLLLELEENIRSLAISGGWVKMVDDWSVEFSAGQISMSVVGPTQKRGPGGRRNRKQSATFEIAADSCKPNVSNICWWRGGKLSKLVFQKGVLPTSVVKKAARQGGSRKIFGIHYTEGSEIPRRIRRFAWRAAVEMSKTASQLAIQVRYLDAHVRWSDLVRPEQTSADGKGSETEASAFRNAVICQKMTLENKIRYALIFGNQKHLPSRVMKNVIEVEQDQDGKDKLWFSENHIPLYLIKEYEEKAEKFPLASKKHTHWFPKFHRRQLKASRSDIFSYLMHKGEKPDKCSCSPCQQDVLLRDAVKCSTCQGFCHKDCTVPSMANMKNEFESFFTCHACYQAEYFTLHGSGMNHLKDQFFLEGQEDYMAAETKSLQQNDYHQTPGAIGNLEIHSEVKPPTSDTKKRKKGTCTSYGLVWKGNKNRQESLSESFTTSHILLKCSADMVPMLEGPICSLCFESYNSDLMYIRCESCSSWYHADALQLEESQVFNLAGFRCCKCRRKGSPICPYMRPEHKRPRMKTSKQGSMEKSRGSMRYGTIWEQPKVEEQSTSPLHANMEDDKDDPLLFFLEKVEIVEQESEMEPEWNTTGTLFQSSRKLPVRRNVKHENDASAYEEAGSHGDVITTEKSISPQATWDFPINSFNNEPLDNDAGNYEEFEPQTYFDIDELAPSHDQREYLYDTPENLDNPFLMDVEESCQEQSEASELPVNMLPCQRCKRTQPFPDLFCEVCKILIHSHCSPWEGQPSWDGRWRCGPCSDWR